MVNAFFFLSSPPAALKPSLGAAACRFPHLNIALFSALITSPTDFTLKLFAVKTGFERKGSFPPQAGLQAAGSHGQLKAGGRVGLFIKKTQIRSVREGGEKSKSFVVGLLGFFFPSM